MNISSLFYIIKCLEITWLTISLLLLVTSRHRIFLSPAILSHFIIHVSLSAFHTPLNPNFHFICFHRFPMSNRRSIITISSIFTNRIQNDILYCGFRYFQFICIIRLFSTEKNLEILYLTYITKNLPKQLMLMLKKIVSIVFSSCLNISSR